MSKRCKTCKHELPYNLVNGIKTYKQKYGYGIKCGCLSKFLSSDDPTAIKIRNQAIIKGRKKLEKEKRKEHKEKKDSVNEKGLMSLADNYFSRYIRLKYSENGNCTCYTCGKLYPIKEVDNGHYIKREHKATRYHENNARPQCKRCNGDTKHNGKQLEFRYHLCNEIGVETVEKLEQLGKTTIKANYLFYRKTADYYRQRVNEIQKELKIKIW